MLLVSATNLFAGPRLKDLNICVELCPNGDARITEVRQMNIDSEGTECYIVLGNLNGSKVSDLKVTDETGAEFENIGKWDIERSRSWKEGKCGIVTKRDGYELCWGLGESGIRTYTTSYVVTNLLRGYSDADGFNYMFVAEGLNPRPSHVKVTIVPEGATDSSKMAADSTAAGFSEENAAIWGFRYRGDVRFEDGAIVAESSEPFSSGSAMIVMARFNKGMFSPAVTSDESFDTVENRAFEGSDYNDDEGFSFWEVMFFLLVFVLFPLLLLFGYLYYVWRARRKVTKDLLWYRDIPSGGNLQWANDVQNAYKYFNTDYNNLLSACILRLIDKGAITIDKTLNNKGKTVQNFVIHELPEKEQQPRLLQMIHEIFQKAAGNDTVLEPKELKTWMKKSYNQSFTDSFIQTLHTKSSIYQFRNQLPEVRQLFGLKKYLKEFSLLDERHVQEVALWKDYMIYATLFGIADQVIKDMKKINPDYFNMDQVAQQMADDMTLPTIYSTLQSSTTRAAMSKAEREARASGRGGSASWRGGGGFSGGGFGGGVR
ncbi:MAG: DUF2207 domain-containing protein [Prevotella sp.]|nr:DUF2207 domain-containing protein [Prevotella sp.]MBQ6730270.1 DUF2207 domain-containing protein [Bacteroidales bacterium]